MALQVPDNLTGTAAAPIKAGDTITSGKDAIEVERVLDDLLPGVAGAAPGGPEGHPDRAGHRAAGPGQAARRQPGRAEQLPAQVQPQGAQAGRRPGQARQGRAAVQRRGAGPAGQPGQRADHRADDHPATAGAGPVAELGHRDQRRAGQVPQRQRRLPDPGVGLLGEDPAAAGRVLAGVPVPGRRAWPGWNRGWSRPSAAASRACTSPWRSSRARASTCPATSPATPNQHGPNCFGLPQPAVPFPGAQFDDGAPNSGPQSLPGQPTADRAAYHGSRGVGSARPRPG